jgi:high-affinity Fe2+/Pb2+ permease
MTTATKTRRDSDATETDATKVAARRDEDEAQRLDRELLELLNELRVVMPGVQVLFGFLLTVPFQQGFSKIDGFQRDVYFATLLLTAVAAVFLMAPSAFHRLTFRAGQKPYLIKLGTRQTIVGMGFLALAMNGALLLLTDMLFGSLTVAITLACSITLFAWLWFGLALRRLASGKKEW